jgi:hypothetical protein
MVSSFVRCALLATVAFAVGAQAAEPAAVPANSMSVYDTALGAGWQNWSWAKTELSVELNGSARRPIKVEAGAYQALYLHHDAFSTTGFMKLNFLIQGSAPDGEVRVFALTDGKVVGAGKLVKLSNTGWTQVMIPLATLEVEDKMIDGLWLQNPTGNNLPRFYVTEIKLD